MVLVFFFFIVCIFKLFYLCPPHLGEKLFCFNSMLLKAVTKTESLMSICKTGVLLISVVNEFAHLSVGSGSFSLSGSADLFLGVPPVNGEQSAYQMGVQVT